MAAPNSGFQKYLLWCIHEYSDFIIPELKSITSLFNIPLKLHNIDQKLETPLFELELPSEECALKILSRTILIKSMYEIWVSGKTHETVYNRLKQLAQECWLPYGNSESTFRIKIESFGKTISFDQKLSRIEELDFLPLEGKVNLNNPDHSFHLVEYYGLDCNNLLKKPHNIYFGRWIGDGQRDKIIHYDLRKRKFIGNTSMDPALALIMANMAQVQTNSFILDPFVGTGSLLIGAAHFGGYVMGTDIDLMLIHGRGKSSRSNQKFREPGESIQANLCQYGLEDHYLDVLVADSSRILWRETKLFDAIITDPPYGVRESTIKIGSKKNYTIQPEVVDSHIPSKIEYKLSHVFEDLLNFSAKVLRLYGRLVYWLPVSRSEYTPENVPHHPCFEVIGNCEQTLTTTVSRRLITMEKVKEYFPGAKCEADVDHYEELSFRERYFENPLKSQKRIKAKKNKDVNKELSNGTV